MGKDIRFFLLLGAGIIAAGWAVTYAGPVQSLVNTGTNGYVTMVRGLEPPAIASAYGGGGTVPSASGGGFSALQPAA